MITLNAEVLAQITGLTKKKTLKRRILKTNVVTSPGLYQARRLGGYCYFLVLSYHRKLYPFFLSLSEVLEYAAHLGEKDIGDLAKVKKYSPSWPYIVKRLK